MAGGEDGADPGRVWVNGSGVTEWGEAKSDPSERDHQAGGPELDAMTQAGAGGSNALELKIPGPPVHGTAAR